MWFSRAVELQLRFIETADLTFTATVLGVAQIEENKEVGKLTEVL